MRGNDLPDRPKLLLVSNDERYVSKLMVSLESVYRVSVAASGRQAIDQAREIPRPDLFMIDIQSLSDIDGYGLIGIFQCLEETRGIPIIYLTESSGPIAEDFGLECGAVDYLTKPIRATKLQATIRTQLELRRLQKEVHTQNRLLHDELDRRLRELNQMQTLTLDAIVELAKIRDYETTEHLIRTQEYVRLLAGWLRQNGHYANDLDGPGVEGIIQAAPLHDIGKVSIPDRILLKPGRLTPFEMEIMKQHCVRGYEALLSVELRESATPAYFPYAKQIARCHHEKWNGTGYPDGLAGLEIPLSARLMAVADTFDALISERVYKPVWDRDYAHECMISLSGIEFDPLIIQAFESVFEALYAISEKYPDPPSS